MKLPRQIQTRAGAAVVPVVLKFSNALLTIGGLVVTNKSDVTIDLYVGKEYVAGGVPDDSVLPNQIASIPIADAQAITMAAETVPARAGSILAIASTDSVQAYRGGSTLAGSNVYPFRVTWPGGTAAQLVSLPFGANSVRVWANAGSCYLFTNPAVVTPIVFDGNGVPSDPSFIGAVNTGGSDIFPLPAGTTQLLFVHYGGNGFSSLLTQYGVSHLYLLDDAVGSSVALDSVAGNNGAYSNSDITYRKPALLPETDFSIQGARDDSAIVGISLPFDDPAPGKDFSLLLTYKKTSATDGFNPDSYLWSSLSGGAGGVDVGDGGNQVFVKANFGGTVWYWSGPALALNSISQVVLTWSKANKRGALYVNGAIKGMAGGPGAPPFGAWGVSYTEATAPLNIGSNAVGKDMIGGYEVAAIFPLELNAPQVAALYNGASGASLSAEVLSFFSDANWAPVSSKIP